MYVRFSKPEFDRKFEEEIHLITPNNKSMGLEELILKVVKEEGRSEKDLEKNHLFVTNLIQQSDFTDEKIASIAGVELSFVKQLRNELRVQ